MTELKIIKKVWDQLWWNLTGRCKIIRTRNFKIITEIYQNDGHKKCKKKLIKFIFWNGKEFLTDLYWARVLSPEKAPFWVGQSKGHNLLTGYKFITNNNGVPSHPLKESLQCVFFFFVMEVCALWAPSS